MPEPESQPGPHVAERPPPEPARLLAALDERDAGDGSLPGATVQALKRGGLDVLLADPANDGAPGIDALRAAWDGWERGRTTPRELLRLLDEAGLRAFLERATATA